MTLSEINVLVGEANWAWPEVVRSIFAPRGINSIVVSGATEALDVIERRNIHTAIVDIDSEKTSGLSIVKVIRRCHPLLPCILVSRSQQQSLLRIALKLDVFSVVAKPVDMKILQDQLNRLFMKRYNSMIFNEPV